MVLLVVGMMFGCSDSPSTPTPPPANQTATPINCSLVGSLPCQIPPPTLCLTQGASNYGQQSPCTFPSPAPAEPAPAPAPPPSFPPRPAPAAPSFAAYLSCQAPTAPSKIVPCNVTAAYGDAIVLSTAITSVAWDWSDGSSSTTVVPIASHTFVQSGAFIVSVTVTGTTSDGARTAQTARAVNVP